jgi:hypothetical protein
LSQIVGDRLHHLEEGPVLDPDLEPSVAGLIRWEALGHLVPLRARVQDPESSVEDRARVLPRSPLPTTMLELLGREMRNDPLPLVVGERHGNGRS